MHTGDGSIVYRVEPGAKWTTTGRFHGRRFRFSVSAAAFNAELDAHTGDGAIRNELGVADLEKSGDRDRDSRTLRARLGDGGRRLRIRTGDGAITLKAR